MDPLRADLIAGALAGGFVQGLSGFAFGMTAMGFWAWSLPPQLAGPLVVFGSLVGQGLGVRSLRAGFTWARTLPFIGGGVVGVPVGVSVLHSIDPGAFKLTIALVLLVYAPAMLFAGDLPRVTAGGRLADAAVGFVGGVLSGIGGLPGPAPTLWCTLRGWEKDVQRAVFQSFNLVMHAVTFATYFAAGLITLDMAPSFAVVGLALVVPTLVGIRAYGRFSERAFRRVVLGLLWLSGVVLLVSAVSDLRAGPSHARAPSPQAVDRIGPEDIGVALG